LTRIYKILPRQDWDQALRVRRFDGSPKDRQDGFIHFSTAAQAPETARLHFRGADDLVVLEVESQDLGPTLIWEASRNDELFPHLYAHLDTYLVRGVTEAPLDAEGVPQVRL
jgi:uncharacterized protein (DUF952 family)